MKNRRVLFLLMVALVSVLGINPGIIITASAQTLNADTNAFAIGKQIDLTLEFHAGKGTQILWPAFSDTLSSAVEIINAGKPDSVTDASGKTVFSQKLTITSFDTGFHVIPPIRFGTIPAGQSDTIFSETQPLLIHVLNVEVDPAAEIKDLKPVLDAPYTFLDFLPWILALLALAFVILLIWFIYQSKKKNKPIIKLPSRPQKPAHEIAIEKLVQLKNEQLWQKGQIKEYYSVLTDILREYFEARFGVAAAEMTSDEILSAMKDHLADAARMNDLKKILENSDMAKFAKARPSGADNELSHTLAMAIVNSTKPTPELKKTTENEPKTEQ